MRRLNLFLACCLFALPAVAQSPAPVPPPSPAPAPAPAPQPAPAPKPMPLASVKVPDGPLYAGDLVVLDLSDSVGDSIDCEIISPPDVRTYAVDSNGKSVAFANKLAGTYVFRVEAESVIGGKIAKSKKRVAFTTVPLVPPTPNPTPAPPSPPGPPVPPPVTVGKPFIVTLVSDSNAMTPGLADVHDSLTLAASPLQSAIATMGGRGTSVDVNSAEYVRRNLAPFLSVSDVNGPAVSPPAIVVQDGRGHVINKIPAPADSGKLITYLKGLTGSN